MPLPFDAAIGDYRQESMALFGALEAGEEEAAWRFKWLHPRFRGRPVTEVRDAALDVTDAQTVVAREYAFETWRDLLAFTEAVRTDGTVERFERAVEAVVSGDTSALAALLQEDPGLIHARSTRRHHATLLHYVAANGVEGVRQRTPPNAIAIAQQLLESGAEVDALADMYDVECSTMSMLVSSDPPAEAGLQTALAETLLDYGARLDGPGSKWQSALMTALTFGYLETARALARRGAPLNDLAAVAGLGLSAETARLLADADAGSRQVALALAAHHGHADVVRLLLDAGANPDRYNPDGFHAHSTPLHQAALAGHTDVVRMLVERGARLDMRDTIYESTPLEWAIHGEREETARFLRQAGQARQD